MDTTPNSDAADPASNSPRPPGRISFSSVIRPSISSQRRPSFVSRWRRLSGASALSGDDAIVISSERPPIPSAFEPTGEVCATPLPILSMIVLSITMLGEFLSANVATPFLLFMVKGFGELHDEADVAFWTGIIVSMFFLTQFLTSLLWATVADRHGRRAVLVVSLFGGAMTCLLFGTTTSIKQAMAVRLLQGIFAGAVGVARGSVAFVTDASNEGRAYAILGFCWGLGGVAGAIIGGSFERPAEKWPGIFEGIPLFVEYPYLLPCAIASSITLLGSILALFLNPDGGPREGAIQLVDKEDGVPDTIPEESEDATQPTPFMDDPPPLGLVGSIGRKVSKRISGYFGSAEGSEAASDVEPAVPLHSPLTRHFSRTSRYNGSAYGYSSATRSRLASVASTGLRASSFGSSLRRRGSNVGPDGLPRDSADITDMNFAQRLLMANEHAVTNIADLWVAAAMNVDNEDPFETDSETDTDEEDAIQESSEDEEDQNLPLPTYRNSNIATAPLRNSPLRHTVRHHASGSMRPGSIYSSRRSSHNLGVPPSFANDGPSPRRSSGNLPSIFAHSGVRVPSAVIDAQQQQQQLSSRISEPEAPVNDLLAPIAESRRASWVDPQTNTSGEADLENGISEKQPSLFSQLPVLVIVQYGLLALHATTHDQIFMSYLVTDFESGGLNLNAGHFAQLIALMCFAQIAYQFYLYPNIGPPRGRFSHLSMFRIGCMLFIPGYITVIFYHPFASAEEDGNLILMTLLALSTAVRYCAITFAYTSVSILLNYMTPPHVVGFANGIAQSIVSLARFIGPILGGYLWSVSIEGNPSGYPYGFLACGAFCSLAVLHSYMIR
jgi:MFS family permease